MTEQNRKCITKEIGKLLSDIWRIKVLAEQEYGSQHPITKKLSGMRIHKHYCRRNRKLISTRTLMHLLSPFGPSAKPPQHLVSCNSLDARSEPSRLLSS